MVETREGRAAGEGGRGSSQSSFIFRVHLPANGACGKKMSNKESTLPLSGMAGSKARHTEGFLLTHHAYKNSRT